jgi:hypothetical protein
VRIFPKRVTYCIVGEKFYEALVESLDMRKGTEGKYADVYDGAVYRSLPRDYSTQPANISLMFNTDGVPVFRSSGFSFWPIYLIINELPYRMRYVCNAL